MNNILSLLSFLAAAIFLYFGTHVLLLNSRARANRFFFCLCLCFTIWSFGYTFVFTAPTEDARWFWYKVGAPGWCFFPPLLLCFILSLTRRNFNLGGTNKVFLAALFIPSIIFYYYVLTDFLLITGFKVTPLGIGEVVVPHGFLYGAYVTCLSGVMLVGPILFAHWGIKTKIKKEKKQALIIIATWVPAMIFGLAVNIILPSAGITTPAVAYLGIIIWIGGIWLAITRYRLMVFTAAIAAENIIASITDMVVLADTDGLIIEANKSAHALLCAEGEDITGRHYSTLFVEEHFLKDSYDKIHDLSSLHQKGEFNLKNSSGETIPVYLTLGVVNDKRDEMVGLALIVHDLRQEKQLEKDIEERKIIEDALRKSEEKYRDILVTMDDGYFETDLSGCLRFFNPSVAKILEYTEEELLGMDYQKFTSPVHISKVFETFHQTFLTGEPARLDWQFVKKNGETAYVDVFINPLKDITGKVTGFRGVGRDVTGHLRREEELRQAKAAAEEATRAKSQFLANMSHEIRTPLNGVIGMTEVALDMNTDEALHSILNTINREADSLLDVINDILDFSKIEAGRMDIESIPFDLRTTFDDVASGFSMRAFQKGIELIAFLNSNVPSLLMGDPGRLRQILVNLVGNAVKFTPSGEVYLRGELLEDRGEDVLIRFSIKDTGIGIPKDKQDSIFESFTQADGSTTRKFGGTGLGTTISRMLVEMMGGKISLESEEGQGATFLFDLVFAKQSLQDELQPKRPVFFQDLKVLIVDDNRNNRFILREYLKSWGCHIVEATRAADALMTLEELHQRGESFDFVLSDYLMPEMNGFELVRQIRSREEFRNIPCIILTSVGNWGDGKSCRDLGIQGYLTKPVRRDELYHAIEDILSGSDDDVANKTGKLVTQHTIKEKHKDHVVILLAEDYPTNQQIVMRHLRSAGYTVDLVENGAQVLHAFMEKTYDLILMDIQMPVMDGYDAAIEIRRFEAEMQGGKRVPIIAMTAHAIKEYINKCRESGMDDYISKPVRRSDLLAMVDKWTSRTVITKDGQTESPLIGQNRDSGEKVIMDYDEALHEFCDDKPFLQEVMDGFVENVKKQLILIRQAIADGDAAMVGKESHSIKGGSGNLKARELSEIASIMEKLGKEGNLQGLHDTLHKMEEAFERLRHFIVTARQ
jgi:PAS domain S-box-containing protein